MLKLLFLTRKGFCREDTEGMAKLIGNGCKSVDNKSMTDKDFEGVDLVVRFGCTSNVPVKKVLNKAHAIHKVFDKPGFRAILSKHNLCPRTWNSLEEFSKDFDRPFAVYPPKAKVVVRPKVHYGGKQLYVCESVAKIKQAINWCKGEYYITEYIEKASEYRVHVLQGRVISIEEKMGQGQDKDKVAWNFMPHKYVKWSDWKESVVIASIKAMKLSKLDFGGVDVIVDKNGKAYVLEINSAIHLPLLEDGTPSYHQKCMAKGFAWIAKHGREHIPIGNEKIFYQRYIHPAIYN